MLIVDPPGGWRYGFPLPYAPDEGESLRDWLVRMGYPEQEADFAAKHCRWWQQNPDGVNPQEIK